MKRKELSRLVHAVLCVVVLCMVMSLSSCESEDEMRSKLIGTWTEKNDLFTDELTLDEEGYFQFTSHVTRYTGSGQYVYMYRENTSGSVGKGKVVNILTLNYRTKAESMTLDIKKLTNSTLQMTDRFGNTFKFTKTSDK